VTTSAVTTASCAPIASKDKKSKTAARSIEGLPLQLLSPERGRAPASRFRG
jgi:hypothetical protein